uniref:Uncharacterized protein n=1 Tax=Hucho hucho TaxID=62062 RepID=A0A4W5PUM8_9TELE
MWAGDVQTSPGIVLEWVTSPCASVDITCMSMGSSVPCLVPCCSCGVFAFMPSRPEEVGEPWVRGRPGFNSQVWRALCRCKHPHQQHSPRAGHSCRVGGTVVNSKWTCQPLNDVIIANINDRTVKVQRATNSLAFLQQHISLIKINISQMVGQDPVVQFDRVSLCFMAPSHGINQITFY